MTAPMTIARVAPTPSGYLHTGNAANFLLNAWFVEMTGGQLALRIDDMDASRARTAYVDDIFEVLQWLGLEWSIGPRNRQDFQANYSMAFRTEHYRQGLTQLVDEGLRIFVCRCSRRELADGIECLRGCIDADLELTPGITSVRAALPDIDIEVDEVVVNLRRAHGDPVLWRRDDLPAYHLVTVLEDFEMGITDVIRGADLLDSSALHRWLGRFVPGATDIRFRHHALITGADGTKLSKSQGRHSPIPRTELERRRIVDLARSLGARLGLAPEP